MDMQESCKRKKLMSSAGEHDISTIILWEQNKQSGNCFYAAGEFGGISLDKALLAGPYLRNNIVGVLLRFRNNKITIAANIEANALRCFWQDDLTQDVPELYQIVVYIFSGKELPCCANYALKKTGSDNVDEYNTCIIETKLKSFCMDDFLKPVISEAQAITLSQEMI